MSVVAIATWMYMNWLFWEMHILSSYYSGMRLAENKNLLTTGRFYRTVNCAVFTWIIQTVPFIFLFMVGYWREGMVIIN